MATGCAAACRGARLDAMVDELAAMGPHQHRQHQARDGADQRGADPTEQLSRKYIAGAAAQPSEPPTPWMLKARPSRPDRPKR